MKSILLLCKVSYWKSTKAIFLSVEQKKNFTSARQDLKLSGVKCSSLLCDVHRPWTIQIGFGNEQLKGSQNINLQKATFRCTRLLCCPLRKTDKSVSTTIYTLIQPRLNLGFPSTWKELAFWNTQIKKLHSFLQRKCFNIIIAWQRAHLFLPQNCAGESYVNKMPLLMQINMALIESLWSLWLSRKNQLL